MTSSASWIRLSAFDELGDLPLGILKIFWSTGGLTLDGVKDF